MASGVTLSLLLGSICFLYKDTLLSMIEIWERSETFTHCFLVLPISLWLIWRKRSELFLLSPVPNFWMLIQLVLWALLWLLGAVTITNSISHFAFVGLIISSVMLVLGLPVSRVIAFPLGFLFFAVPVGEFLLPTLMEWTANFTIYALRLTGIPVYRDGLQFVIPSGNWSVVEACSGVRYLIASLTVGTLFAYLNYTSIRRRMIFVGISIVVPIVANWLRAYMIVMLGHLSGNKIAVGVDHIIYGWVFFGVVVISMFLIGVRWAEIGSLNVKNTPVVGGVFLRKNESLFTLGAMIVGVIFCAVPVLFFNKISVTQNSNAVTINLPSSFKNKWNLIGNLNDVWKPAYKGSAAEVSGVFSDAGENVGLYIGYYRNQFFDKKLINSQNVLVRSDDPRWSGVSRGELVVDSNDGAITVNTSVLSYIGAMTGSRDQQMDVWYLYWVDGRSTNSDYFAKIYTGISKIFNRGDDAAVIVLHTLRVPGRDSKDVLTRFLQDNYLQIDELLHTARAGNGSVVTTIEKS